PATSDSSTLPLHDALPISGRGRRIVLPGGPACDARSPGDRFPPRLGVIACAAFRAVPLFVPAARLVRSWRADRIAGRVALRILPIVAQRAGECPDGSGRPHRGGKMKAKTLRVAGASTGTAGSSFTRALHQLRAAAAARRRAARRLRTRLL